MGGIEQDVIEVDGAEPIAAPLTEQYPARYRLLENVGDSLRSPVGIGAEVHGMAPCGEGLGGKKDHAAVTAQTARLVAIIILTFSPYTRATSSGGSQ